MISALQKESVASMRREQIAHAITQSPTEKFWAGLDLFDHACAYMKKEIKNQLGGHSKRI